MLVHPNAFDKKKYKTTDHDVVLQLKTCLLKIMNIHHVYGHQNRSKNKYLTLQANPNIRADKLISANTRKFLQTNIINTPMALYMKQTIQPK